MNYCMQTPRSWQLFFISERNWNPKYIMYRIFVLLPISFYNLPLFPKVVFVECMISHSLHIQQTAYLSQSSKWVPLCCSHWIKNWERGLLYGSMRRRGWARLLINLLRVLLLLVRAWLTILVRCTWWVWPWKRNKLWDCIKVQFQFLDNSFDWTYHYKIDEAVVTCLVVLVAVVGMERNLVADMAFYQY